MSFRKKPLTEQQEKTIKLIRALSNGISIILFFLMLISAIQMGGLDRLIRLTGAETITFVCVLVMFFGIVWSMQKPLAGGILIILTYVVMSINLGTPFPDAVMPMFFFLGVLNIYLGRRG
jgi:uncharacterized membrane protein YqjE